jgi:hypothetical protein
MLCQQIMATRAKLNAGRVEEEEEMSEGDVESVATVELARQLGAHVDNNNNNSEIYFNMKS